MTDAVLYGPAYSAYTRTARLALIEKGVDYRLVEVDFSGSHGMPADHVARHPFAKVPAFAHGDFLIYETTAICRYVDAAFAGPALQPAEPKALGRMAQIVAILDAYLSLPIRMGLTSQLVTGPLMGRTPDNAVVADAKATVGRGLPAIEALLGDGPYLAGAALSLADLHAAPLIQFLSLCPGCDDLLGSNPRLTAWWDSIRERPTLVATRPDMNVFRQP